MFIARCKLYVKSETPDQNSKKQSDLQKQGEYFKQWDSRPSPDILVDFFFAVLIFGRHGQERWPHEKKLQLAVDEDGHGGHH